MRLLFLLCLIVFSSWFVILAIAFGLGPYMLSLALPPTALLIWTITCVVLVGVFSYICFDMWRE